MGAPANIGGTTGRRTACDFWRLTWPSSSPQAWIETLKSTGPWQPKSWPPGQRVSCESARPLVVAKLEEFFREKLVTVRSTRLIDELFVFIYNGSRAEAMSGYNDDLVMSYAMGLWIRETALRLRAEGIELQKKAMNSITSNQGVYTPTNNQNDSWTMEINKKQESLDWLL